MRKVLMIVSWMGFILGLAFLPDGFCEGSLRARYEPHVLTVTGRVSLVVFPGPPGYASVEDGDEPEHVLILHLEMPLDIVGDATTGGEDGEGELNTGSYTNLVRLHLVDVNDHVHLAGPGDTLRVRATGTLTEGHTGHHRTEVVMFASLIEAIPDASRD